MDYSLAALKLLCAQLKDAREVPSRNGFTLGCIESTLTLCNFSLFVLGMYVMVVGGYLAQIGEPPMIMVKSAILVFSVGIVLSLSWGTCLVGGIDTFVAERHWKGNYFRAVVIMKNMRIRDLGIWLSLVSLK
ncbi:hypothetical protein K1719_007204 [Acacia pycnantha]|nr:hypothetical protein K1719_007204 [Acacia pycnantha]